MIEILWKCNQCEVTFYGIFPNECPICGLPDVQRLASHPKIERKIEETEET